MAIDPARRDAVLTRVMGACFGAGSLCFALAPLSAYASALGSRADAVTYFVGSVLFTLGGGAQCVLAAPERQDRPTGLAAWRTAWIQSVGTLLFNLMTLAAIAVPTTSSRYDAGVWGPDALGSVCFLVSGTVFYLSSPRRGLLPRRDHRGWWEAAVNLLGCVLFGVSAGTGYVPGSSGEMISVGVTNWTTVLGACCFLACALAACGLGVTLKAPRLRTLRRLPREIAQAVEHGVQEVRASAEAVSEAVSEAVAAEIESLE